MNRPEPRNENQTARGDQFQPALFRLRVQGILLALVVVATVAPAAAHHVRVCDWHHHMKRCHWRTHPHVVCKWKRHHGRVCRRVWHR